MCLVRESRLNNIPFTLRPIHPATVLSGYFIFKLIPKPTRQDADQHFRARGWRREYGLQPRVIAGLLSNP